MKLFGAPFSFFFFFKFVYIAFVSSKETRGLLTHCWSFSNSYIGFCLTWVPSSLFYFVQGSRGIGD